LAVDGAVSQDILRPSVEVAHVHDVTMIWNVDLFTQGQGITIDVYNVDGTSIWEEGTEAGGKRVVRKEVRKEEGKKGGKEAGIEARRKGGRKGKAVYMRRWIRGEMGVGMGEDPREKSQ
jgi:hypothetical protein